MIFEITNITSFVDISQINHCVEGPKLVSLKDLNKDVISVTSQCTKTGENGEIVTVSITTEESHQATVLGKLMNANFESN